MMSLQTLALTFLSLVHPHQSLSVGSIRSITSNDYYYDHRSKKYNTNNNNHDSSNFMSRKRTSKMQLYNQALKRQTVIFDGAEFLSIMAFLKHECPEVLFNNSGILRSNTAAASYETASAGYMTFITCVDPQDASSRIMGILVPVPPTETNANNDNIILIQQQNDEMISLYANTIVKIPKGVQDSVAISTAAAALCGVHCGGMRRLADDNDWKVLEKIIVLGGGDHACFVAKALSHLGSQVTLVTTRPMALKDTPLNPLRDTNIRTIPPMSSINGKNQLGFAELVGTFDSVIDSLKDELKSEMISFWKDGVDRVFGDDGILSTMRWNGCSRYISTVTKSQKIVLKEGLLFARDPVLKYQQNMEKVQTLDESSIIPIPYPTNFQCTLQQLLDGKVLFPVDRNELGSHQNKAVFVRGCSFPDYAEVEIWPNDKESGLRFGFPILSKDFSVAMKDDRTNTISDSDRNISDSVSSSGSDTYRDSLEKNMEHFESTSQEKDLSLLNEEDRDGDDDEEDNQNNNASNSINPFVLQIESLSHLRQEIVTEKKTAILFVSAPYCRTCRSVTPQYNRMARISKEEKKSDLLFAKATTAGKYGKQITSILGIESVPSFVLFQKGERYGEPFGISKLPSETMDAILQRLKDGEAWDPSIIAKNKESQKQRTSLR